MLISDSRLCLLAGSLRAPRPFLGWSFSALRDLDHAQWRACATVAAGKGRHGGLVLVTALPKWTLYYV